MAEPKAKTLQQKLGFFDEDLKSPVHDDILKWIQANLNAIVLELYPSIRQWSDEEVKRLSTRAEEVNTDKIKTVEKQIDEIERKIASVNWQIESTKQDIDNTAKRESEGEQVYTTSDDYRKRLAVSLTNLEQLETERGERTELLKSLNEWIGLGEPPARKDFVVRVPDWEFVVTSQSTQSYSGYQSSKNIIGFVDMRATVIVPILHVNGVNDYGTNIKPLTWGQGFDLEKSMSHIYFEAKTRIPNLGELFRQINMYRTYLQGPFVVVSPDDKEADVIRQQGIKFVKYPSPRDQQKN